MPPRPPQSRRAANVAARRRVRRCRRTRTPRQSPRAGTRRPARGGNPRRTRRSRSGCPELEQHRPREQPHERKRVAQLPAEPRGGVRSLEHGIEAAADAAHPLAGYVERRDGADRNHDPGLVGALCHGELDRLTHRVHVLPVEAAFSELLRSVIDRRLGAEDPEQRVDQGAGREQRQDQVVGERRCVVAAVAAQEAQAGPEARTGPRRTISGTSSITASLPGSSIDPRRLIARRARGEQRGERPTGAPYAIVRRTIASSRGSCDIRINDVGYTIPPSTKRTRWAAHSARARATAARACWTAAVSAPPSRAIWCASSRSASSRSSALGRLGCARR